MSVRLTLGHSGTDLDKEAAFLCRPIKALCIVSGFTALCTHMLLDQWTFAIVIKDHSLIASVERTYFLPCRDLKEQTLKQYAWQLASSHHLPPLQSSDAIGTIG